MVKQKLLSCFKCMKKFRSKFKLKRHTHQHHGAGIFECSSCSAKFKRENSLRQHINDNCNARTTYSCFECGISFNRKDTLRRHVRSSCSASSKEIVKIECSNCGLSFKHKDTLRRHVLHVCNQERPHYECAECGKSFGKKFSLLRHITCKHIAVRKCPDCDFTYIRLRDLATHVTAIHSDKILNTNIKCPLCEDSFHRTKEALSHLIEHHDIDLKHEHLYFDNMDEFYEWKKKIERTTVTSFRTRNSKQTKKDFLHLYTCHRSGSYESRTPSRKRKMKEKGSKKINAFCPAEIAVRRSKVDGTCRVYYIQNHLGHTINDKTELTHMFISKKERMNIASKISAGIPYGKILMENAEAAKQLGIDRLRLLSNKDLHNIAASYNLKRPLAAASIAPVTVESFVIEHTESILYHKKTDEKEEKYPFLKKEDTILVLMTQSQMKWLKQYGRKMIAIHSTSRLNNTNLLLYSILVFDEYHETYAAAFALSNRKDEKIIDVFLESVKNKVGEIRTRKLITEVGDSYYSNWEKIMGAPDCCHFSMFHMREAWRRNLKKIETLSKRLPVLRKLHEMSFQAEENEFVLKMKMLLKDDDFELKDFLNVFRMNYRRSAKNWAYCYRRQADIHTDMSIEAFHKHLKYSSGQPNRVKDLVSCLHFLSKYLVQKEIDYENKSIRGHSCFKVKELLRRHEILEDPNVEVLVMKSLFEEGWYVSVSSKRYKDANTYFVTFSKGNVCENCKLYCEKCDTCLHKYRCTCVDNSVRFNMCPHIHVLGSPFFRSQVVANIDDIVSGPLDDEMKKSEQPEIKRTESFESETIEIPTQFQESLEIEKDHLIDQFKEVVNKVSNANHLELIKKLLKSTDVADIQIEDMDLSFDRD